MEKFNALSFHEKWAGKLYITSVESRQSFGDIDISRVLVVHRARISQTPVIIVNPISPREVPENLVVPGVSGTLRTLKFPVSLGLWGP